MSDPGAVSASTAAGRERDDAELRRLHPRVVRAWRVTGLLWLPIVGVGVLALATLLADDVMPWWLAPAEAVALGAALLLALVGPPLRYRAWRFAVRPTDVFLRRGVLVHVTSIVPHARIQHVDTQRGPLARWLGLADLVLFTAGTRGAVLTIPGLAVSEAEALRDRLAALAGLDDAV